VDSGKTLNSIDKALRTLRPTVRPRYIAVMRAGSREDAASDDAERSLGSGLRHHSLRCDGRLYDVEYMLVVEQQHYDEQNLPKSFRDHAGSSFDMQFEPTQLTSSVFWKMVADAGWKREDDVPPARTARPLGSVPKFPELVEANAPLIAYKLHRLLSRGGRPLPVDPLLVRKAELGTQEVAASLVSMFDYSSIAIPPEDLENESLYANGEASLDLERRDWWLQLRSAQSPGTRAILLDEFRLEGGSLNRLARVCQLAGLAIERVAVLVDFGRIEDRISSVPIQSLYRIPLLEDWS
jgi:hypothetical protein